MPGVIFRAPAAVTRVRPLSSSCLIFFRPIFLKLQLKKQNIQTFIGFDVQSDNFVSAFSCRVWFVKHVERSLRGSVGLVPLTLV